MVSYWKRQEADDILQKPITDADYADDLVTPTQAESLLHSLEKVTGCIGLYVNANETESIRFK